jgi:hypothetical protein
MLSPTDYRELAEVKGLCLTVFEPVRDVFSQVARTQTRLMDAARDAEKMLAARGYEESAREAFISPLVKLAANTDWSSRSGSIVVFLSPGFMKAVFWPKPLHPLVRLADEFFLLPLLQDRDASGTFWLLGLSVRGVRLFRGGPENLTRIDLPENISKSVADAAGFDFPDHDLEGRSAPGASNRQMAAIRFGTSEERQKGKRHLHDHFARVNEAIYPIVAHTGFPLILAGVSRELAIYREVNRCPNLTTQAIAGSPDALTEHQLYEKACGIRDALDHGERCAAQMEAARNKGRLLENTDDIRVAARSGRVNRLFIDSAAGRNGGESIDADLINSAALAVIAHSGEVEFAAGLNLPNSIAAELRYVLPERTAPATAVGATNR